MAMKLIFSVFNRFRIFAITCISAGILLVLVGNLYYQTIKTDQYLWTSLSAFMHSHVKDINDLPLGWEVVPLKEQIMKDEVKIEFHNDSYLSRQISSSVKIGNEYVTLTKHQDLLWSKYDVLFVVAIVFVLISIFILLFYVLKMFLISHVWKSLVSVERVFNKESIEINTVLFTGFKKLNKAVAFAKQNKYLQKLFEDEYSFVINRLIQDIDFAFEQKKVPEQHAQELLYFKTLVVN